jgi:hypothetical protein
MQFHRGMNARAIPMGADGGTNGEKGVATEGRERYSPLGMLALLAVVDKNGR